MIQVDDLGRQRVTADKRPLVTPQSKWVYHYRQYTFMQGSHYILFEDAANADFPLRSGGVDWPSGCIFAHGGNLTYDRLLASLEGGMPSVMLYNTGGVTQSFGSLYNLCITNKMKMEREAVKER